MEINYDIIISANDLKHTRSYIIGLSPLRQNEHIHVVISVYTAMEILGLINIPTWMLTIILLFLTLYL
jgi:hypothetical protein